VSIESVRKFVEKYGIGCFALLFLSFSISALTLQCGKNGNTPGQETNVGVPIATVGKFAATSDQVDGIVTSQRHSGASFSPLDEATTYSQGLNNVLDHVTGLAFAASKGLVLDDKAVEEAIPSLWAQQEDTHRQILVQGHKLAPNASQKEFEAAYEKDSGRSLDQERQQFTDDFNTAFNDPAKKELIRSEVANQSLNVQYAAKTNITDDDLKATYSTVSVQRISFDGKNGVDADTQAQKALADIKGGMSFEDAIKKYTTAKPEAGKSITAPIDISAQIAQYLPEYKPLFKLKQGEVSEPIKMGTGASIFKVVKISENLPPDFDKNKDQLRKDLQKQTASTNLTQDLEAFKKANPPKWASPAYEAMYDYGATGQDTTLSPEKRAAKYAAIEAEAKGALNGSDGRVAALALFAANSAIYDSATPEKKKAMAADRIAALTAVLQGSESPALRIELVDLDLAADKPKDAVDQLKAAALALTGTSVEDQKNYEGILAKLDAMKASKKISDDDAKIVQSTLDKWLVTMHQEDAMKAQTEKQEADLKKQNDALMKKQAADAAAAAAKAKAASAAKPSTTAPAKPAVGTTPPATTATTGK
jgi:hypothetical protein